MLRLTGRLLLFCRCANCRRAWLAHEFKGVRSALQGKLDVCEVECICCPDTVVVLFMREIAAGVQCCSLSQQGFVVSGLRHCSALQDELDACKAECMDVESRQQGLETHLSSNLRRRQQELQEVLMGADAEAERWVTSGTLAARSHKAVLHLLYVGRGGIHCAVVLTLASPV